jgi:hypothetical protein
MEENIKVLDLGEFIIEDPILNELEIGYIPKLKVTVKVNSIEGDNIPHMHLTNTNGKDVICIKIFSAEFFPHGSKQGTLNKSEARSFDKFMREKNKKDVRNRTNWEIARDFWIENKTPNYTGPGYDAIQPDYTQLL